MNEVYPGQEKAFDSDGMVGVSQIMFDVGLDTLAMSSAYICDI